MKLSKFLASASALATAFVGVSAEAQSRDRGGMWFVQPEATQTTAQPSAPATNWRGQPEFDQGQRQTPLGPSSLSGVYQQCQASIPESYIRNRLDTELNSRLRRSGLPLGRYNNLVTQWRQSEVNVCVAERTAEIVCAQGTPRDCEQARTNIDFARRSFSNFQRRALAGTGEDFLTQEGSREGRRFGCDLGIRRGCD